MWRQRTGLIALLVLALGCAAAWGDDGRKPASDDPDPGFLEFLGSVDRLAEVNPDYLTQADPVRPETPNAKPAVTPPPAPPPPPPPPRSPPPPPSASNAAGGQNNE
jgi:hypothetical protein